MVLNIQAEKRLRVQRNYMRIVGKKLRNAADIQLGMCKYLLFSFK